MPGNTRNVGIILAVTLHCAVTIAAAQDEPQRPRSESQRLITMTAQSDPKPAGTDVSIELHDQGNDKGVAKDSRFASFDAPFSLRNHFCPSMKAAACDVKIAKHTVTLLYDGQQDAAIRIDGETKDRPFGGKSITLSAEVLRTRAGRDRRVDILIKVGGDAVNAISLTFDEMPQLAEHTFAVSGTDELAFVRLDRTGVAAMSFLNPRWPTYLDPRPAKGGKKYLTFVNRLSDRQFIVTFSGIGAANRWKFLNADLHLSECAAEECNAVLVVAPSGTRRVPLELLTSAYVKAEPDGTAKVVTFDVAVFHEETQLANPRGYFSLVQYEKLENEASKSTWNASATGSYGFEPDLSDRRETPDDSPVISDLATRGGGNDHFFTGTVSIGLKQSLGGHANSEVQLRLKSGAYGTKANITATKYRLNVFGVQGSTYSAGLFTVAEPSEGIALSETGENAGVHIGYVDVNHIWRKYVPKLQRTLLDFEAKPADGDHSATLFQIKSAPWLTWSNGQVDFVGLIGRKQTERCEVLVDDGACPKKPGLNPPAHPNSFKLKQIYGTVGGELVYRPAVGWGSTIAVFRSWLRPFETDATPYATSTHLQNDTGDGTVGMLSVSWTKLDRAYTKNDFDVPAKFTIRGQLGAGTGVSRGGARNTAYIGETASFAPDLLFLSVLAPVLDTERGTVGSGLANKQYMSVLFTSSQYSPLLWIAKALRIPSNDIDGQSTTIRIHDYRFIRWGAGLGKHAGTELDMIFALDSPSKVTYSMSLAWFRAGSAFKDQSATLPGTDPLIRGFQYSATAQVTVKM